MNDDRRFLVAPIVLSTSAILALSGCSVKKVSMKKSRSETEVFYSAKKPKRVIAQEKPAACVNTHHQRIVSFKKPISKEESKEPQLFALNRDLFQIESKSKLHISAAKYKWTQKKILVKEATQIKIPVPASYKRVTYKKLVKAAQKRIVYTKPLYKIVTKREMIEPAKYVWVKGNGPIEKIDKHGNVVHLVKIAPKYRVRKLRVLVKPATKRVVEIPPKYEITTKLVVDKPAHTKVVTIPAVYKVVRVKTLVKPPLIKEFNTIDSDMVADNNFKPLQLNKKAKSVLGL